MFGPTTGDKVRLGDTELWVEIEKDFTTYGDECKFGGGESNIGPCADSEEKSFETVLVRPPIEGMRKSSILLSQMPWSLTGAVSSRCVDFFSELD